MIDEQETWLFEEVIGITSGSGWWVRLDNDMEPGNSWFEPIAVFVLGRIKNRGDERAWELVLPLTASRLQGSAFDIAVRNGRFEFSKLQLEEPLFHESQFEVIGEKLKASELGGI